MIVQLAEAATHLVRDLGKPIRAFSGASIMGHAIWIATYHDHKAACKAFRSEGTFSKVLEAFANLWGSSLEYPDPDIDKAKCKGEELSHNGTEVKTTIRVLEGSGYYFAVRFPEEVPNWKARQIINEIVPLLIKEAEAAYNPKEKHK